MEAGTGSGIKKLAGRSAATRRAQDAKLSNRGNSYEGIFLNLIGYRERVLGSFKLSSLKSIVEMNSTFETASLAYSEEAYSEESGECRKKKGSRDAETYISYLCFEPCGGCSAPWWGVRSRHRDDTSRIVTRRRHRAVDDRYLH